MACANKTRSSFVIRPVQESDPSDQPAFLRAIVVFIDVFREALEMRRAAHKRCPFNNE